jgi:parallel beta-helix repeat protein
LISPQTVGLVMVAVLTARCGIARADFYVSTTGNDANSGTKEQPFRTIEHARDCVRQQIKEGSATRGPITVWIAAGEYYLDRTFELTDEDSGVKGSLVSYRAEPGEETCLIGGRRISPDDFKPVEDPQILNRLDAAARGRVLVVDLKALGLTDLGAVAENGKRCELFFNDKPLVLARWPNEGFVNVVEVTGGQPISSHGISGDKIGKFTYDGDRPSRWSDETDIWLQGYWFWDWAEQFQKLETIDAKTRTFTLTQPYHGYGYRKGQRYRAVNVLAELDVPGEWYLDRRTSLLYVWPPEGTAKARIVFSTLESPCVLLKNASYVVLRDLIVEATRGEAVKMLDGKGNLVAGCTIRNTGGTGVVVEGGSESGVTGCDIYQTGMAGITISGGDRRTLTPAGNFATNNHIHHFGRLQRTYSGAIHLSGVGNRAAHNLIHDAPHWAVSFTDNENVMELNEIHDVCQETDDVGVFYTGRNWTVRGNIIRHNFIHHVNGPLSGPRACSAQGVYLDDCASGTVVLGNMIYKTSRAMLLGGGRDNVIENNVIFDCGESICFDNRGLGWAQDSVDPGGVMRVTLEQVPYRQPPWSEKYPQLLTILQDDPGSPKGNFIRLNVVYRSKPMKLAKEVSQFGTVADNLTTDEDLGFQNAGAMDFRLRDNSMIFQKLPKFHVIPFEKIGLQLDEYRKSLPARQASK